MTTLGSFLAAIEGTTLAAQIAMGLALFSAIAHAFFGALQKGRYDPWLMRGAIDVWYGCAGTLAAIFLIPAPTAEMIPILAGVFIIHTVYKWLMAMAYERALYTVVYPVVRGTSPFITVIFAYFLFAEVFTALQWLGVAILSLAILGLAAVNMKAAGAGLTALKTALIVAFLGGLATAAYTTYDAWGIRQTADPIHFLIWFFAVDGIAFPIIAAVRYHRMAKPPALSGLLSKGFLGALVAIGSFGAVMLATRLGAVGEAAVLRETSTVFAALIGWFWLKEPVGPVKATLMAIIASGAVLVEIGG